MNLALRTLAIMIAVAPAALIAQTPGPAAPINDILTIELWADEDRITHGDAPVEERLLREAQAVLSGMIYGWDVVYTPEWPERGVERYVELTPSALIRWGDPRLRVREIEERATEFFARTLFGQIDFALSRTDRARLATWDAIATARAVGVGTAAMAEGLDGKLRAIDEAIIHALREWLRLRYPNRPRRVVGSVVLREVPRVRTTAGEYEARVEIGLVIERVEPYLSF